MKNKYKSSANIVASRLISSSSVNADELKDTPLCAIRSKNHNVVRKRNGRKEKSNLYRSSLAAAVQGALFFLGTAAIALPHAAFAESGVGDSTHAHPYNISAGPLEDALNHFARQTRVKLSFAAADVKDIATQGLNGNFSVQGGLNRLLTGSGLEAVPQANGYTVRKLPAISG